jgi:uncharacterized protein (DUF952 family)
MSTAQHIYHLAAAADWQAALATGRYSGSPDDRRDGFMHFSDGAQVVESAARHRAGRTDQILVCVVSAALGQDLRWEPSRGGQLFPHLYGPLDVAIVLSAVPLPLGSDGRHVFPALLP